MLKAYASGSSKGSAGYTKAATKQAIASGMKPKSAKELVSKNAQTGTRTSPRQNFVKRTLGR